MGWFTKFLTSSIGQKFVMAGTGLFMMLFLVVHLLGNFQLLASDGGEAFNSYAYFMTHFWPIKLISYSLYAFILLHTFLGISLWRANQAARGDVKYAVNHSRPSEFSGRRMAWLGIVIFVFILIHLYQFWLQMKLGVLDQVAVKGLDHTVADLYTPVAFAFTNLGYVVFYVACMVVIAFHLWHGFWSAFQTLGLTHPKWTPLIKGVGLVYAIGVPAGFAAIPILMYASNP